MSNPYIIFNGVSSEDLGFVIEQLPEEPGPRRNIEEIDIPGRDGSLIRDLGNFSTSQSRLKLNTFGHDVSDVYAWLRGEGWLTTSDDPTHMRWVGFYDSANDTRFRASGKCYDTITVSLRLWPFKHLVSQTPLSFTTSQTFRGQGNAEALPVITVYGRGDVNLMVNGATVLIDALSGSIVLDSDARTAYTLDVAGNKLFAGRKVTLMGDWPKLLPAGDVTNRITLGGGITSVQIEPWWRWF